MDLPDVPTLLESGYPSLVMDGSWLALFAPAGTPAEIISKLHRGVAIAMQSTKVAEAVRKGGYDLGSGNSSEEFRRFVGMEIQRYAEIAKSANIELH
jgi:tripartite-type tricarboxylate transporter receptor subunit TctC